MTRSKLEIACFTKEAAIIAAHAGVDRIELCDNVAVGGTTPDFCILESLSHAIEIPIYVMIRPRGGGFTYSEGEIMQMLNDIKRFKGFASGFVFGILDSKNCVSLSQNRLLVEAADPLPCTFHRAFDRVEDMGQALENVVKCGFKAILTSGGERAAAKGSSVLQNLVQRAQGRIEVIAGGGVRSSNVSALKAATNVTWFHSSAITNSDITASELEVQQLRHLMTSS
ncbi:MAG: hypothetical protein M1818_005878 [Claussenomyces sp. TS43310]|nr:MAG: hypothetical protein M1818_005878 [Claussenomyces sp. TS43310]